MPSPLERRRHSRLVVPLSVHYQTQCPVSGELHQGQGVIRDISLSGSFFHLDHTPAFQPGQILNLTITAPLPFPDDHHVSHLTATGEVIRLELPKPANPYYGVAVNFLQELGFAALELSVILMSIATTLCSSL